MKLSMRRGHRPEEQANHERWLVSYADFITLLLAVFAVMYALSQVNEGKYRVMAGSLVNTIAKEQGRRDNLIVAHEPAPPPIAPIDDLAAKRASRIGEAQLRQQEKMRIIARDIMAAFAPLVKDGQVRMTQSERGVRVEINASALFPLGEATLQGDSIKALNAVGQVLRNGEHAIHVEGHTDDIPIITPKFPSNWELSAVRASSVVRLLIENGVQATRLTAVGYGENRPVESNDSEEGRARNRRVTLMILSSLPDVSSDSFSDTEDLPAAAAPDSASDPLAGTSA
ncbi:flagellar motor protein MotD [Nitrosospira sp. Nsp13]|uniref:flagellar motor protein MotD n=1 Tax=Nitrosospira sp. Nsp13 TaxID=1855332 RepID=UPI000B84826A|nr:flagellar motor protein MotD [Nitrosospira sp. Nsp13]